MEKIIKKLKRWNSIFCSGVVCKTNLKRDIVMIFIACVIATFFIINSKKIISLAPQQETAAISTPAPVSENQISNDVSTIQKNIDTKDWKLYQNKFYGFEVKYPDTWSVPQSQPKSASSKWESHIQFRSVNSDESNPYVGFDVVVYDVAKVKELNYTDEFPGFKSEDLKADPTCASFSGYLIETGNYPAEEVYVPIDDRCYRQALFFSIIKDQYIYNIVPVLNDGVNLGEDAQISVNNKFPEFYAAVSTLDLINIVRPKPVPPKPKITAPMPFVYAIDSLGRRVCNKKNDHPMKSLQHKGKHLDMECCLDPDEYPNPWCYYDPKKYGKYL